MIIEVARGVIADRGFAATTLRSIAQAAGVSLGTVTYHFAGIAEILGAVVRDETESFHAAIVDKALAAEDAESAVRALVDGFFAADERTHQHWRIWLDFWGLSAHDDEHARWQGRAHRQWLHELRLIFERGCDEGRYRIAHMPAAMIDLAAMIDGLGIQAYQSHSPVGPAQARKQLLGWIERNFT
jgi:AcrR family transcriptional regulator